MVGWVGESLEGRELEMNFIKKYITCMYKILKQQKWYEKEIPSNACHFGLPKHMSSSHAPQRQELWHTHLYVTNKHPGICQGAAP